MDIDLYEKSLAILAEEFPLWTVKGYPSEHIIMLEDELFPIKLNFSIVGEKNNITYNIGNAWGSFGISHEPDNEKLIRETIRGIKCDNRYIEHQRFKILQDLMLKILYAPGGTEYEKARADFESRQI